MHMVGTLSNRLCQAALSSLLFVEFCHLGLLTSPTAIAADSRILFEKTQEHTCEAFIRDIAFGSVVKGGKEQLYCKVLVLEDKEIQFLDETGEIVTRKSLVVARPGEAGKRFGREAILSDKGNFVAIHDYTVKSSDDIYYIVEEEYIICDDRGEETYRIKGPLEGTASGYRLFISDKEGSAVGARLEYGALDFYSSDGDMKTVPIFGDIGWGKSTGGKAVFSENGDYLAVLVGGSATRAPGLRPTNTDVWAILFDRNGDELWRRKVNEDHCGNIAISPGGEYVFFKGYSYVGDEARNKGEQRELSSVTFGLHDKQGNGLSLEDTSLSVFGSFCFSPKADYMVLAGGGRIRLMRAKDGSTVFEKEIPWSGRVKELLFSADGEYLIVKTETNPLFLLNMKGELVWRNYFYPGVRKTVSKNGFLAFSFPYKYEIFSRTQEEE